MKKKLIALSLVLALLPIIALTGCAPKADTAASYDISAAFDEETMTVTADMKTVYRNDSETTLDAVKFHLYPAAYAEGAKIAPVALTDVDIVFPNGVSYGSISIASVKLKDRAVEYALEGDDKDILAVPVSLKPTEKADIRIQFTVKLPNARHRLGFFDGKINLGNWYPIVCKLTGGKWDTHPYYPFGDPFNSDVADYNVTFKFPAGYTFAASGDYNVAAGETTAAVTGKAMRDFAVVLTKRQEYKTVANGVTVRYIGDAGEEKYLETAVKALATFSNLFGKYPYDSLTVVKTAFNTGGMEYPTMVMVSDALSESLTHEAVIHEISHQWWYAVVGNDQVREAWLDEGLAEYSTTMFYELNDSYDVSRKDRIADALGAFLTYLELYGKNDTSMIRPVNGYATQLEYTYMTYVKGQLMFESIRELIGDAAFKKGLASYYKDNMYKTAAADDLIGALEKAAGRELKNYFNSWLEGKVEMFANV